jgi:catechol 2,3-dioxygenase-like lactoylglutathione lyase family enzyme
VTDATPLRGAGLVGFVGSSDLTRSRAFYEGVLGLAVVDENAFACVFDVAGTMLRVTAVTEVVTAPYTVLGWAVDDIDTVIDGLRDRGITFARYDGMDQDDRDIWTAPGGGRIAWFADPDGHTLSLTQYSG